MIVSLGQGVPYNYRMPFTRPDPAKPSFRPSLAPTGFFSNISPFQQTMQPMAAFRPNLPRMPAGMRPGNLPDSGGRGPAMDAGGDAAPAQIRGFGFTPRYGSGKPQFGRLGARGPGPGSMVVASLTPSMPQPQAQIPQGPRRGPAYGSNNAFPARTMREGMWPQVRSTAAGIRAGVVDSSSMINQLMPQAFTARNRQIQNVYNGNRSY